jgi:hypothetical protein
MTTSFIPNSDMGDEETIEMVEIRKALMPNPITPSSESEKIPSF